MTRTAKNSFLPKLGIILFSFHFTFANMNTFFIRNMNTFFLILFLDNSASFYSFLFTLHSLPVQPPWLHEELLQIPTYIILSNFDDGISSQQLELFLGLNIVCLNKLENESLE